MSQLNGMTSSASSSHIAQFYENIDSFFSIPQLEWSGVAVIFLLYFWLMLIPLLIRVFKGCDTNDVFEGMRRVVYRILVSIAPFVGVPIAIYLWWGDMKDVLLQNSSELQNSTNGLE